MSDYNDKQCSECGFCFEGEDILACFMRKREEGDSYYGNKTDEEIRETAGMYGWTEAEPKCFKKQIGVELAWDHPQHYDGVSYWMCPKCKTTWNRFTGKKEAIPEHKGS